MTTRGIQSCSAALMIVLLLGGEFRAAIAEPSEKSLEEQKELEELERKIKNLRKDFHPEETWTNAELVKQSDLIVIGKCVSGTDLEIDPAKAWLVDKDDASVFIVRSAKIAVSAVVKGPDPKLEQLEVLYVRYGKNVIVLTSRTRLAILQTKLSVPSFIRVGERGIEESESPDGGTRTIEPTYLLFLKRRADGKYEPASGARLSHFSFRRMAE